MIKLMERQTDRNTACYPKKVYRYDFDLVAGHLADEERAFAEAVSRCGTMGRNTVAGEMADGERRVPICGRVARLCALGRKSIFERPITPARHLR